MYNDKVIDVGSREFEFDAVWYTGGGIYWYVGKFLDGKYFVYADLDDGATILDADPLEDDEEFDYAGLNPDWTEEHMVATSDLRFPIKILEKCIKDKKNGEGDCLIDISEADARARIDLLKEWMEGAEK